MAHEWDQSGAAVDSVGKLDPGNGLIEPSRRPVDLSGARLSDDVTLAARDKLFAKGCMRADDLHSQSTFQGFSSYIYPNLLRSTQRPLASAL